MSKPSFRPRRKLLVASLGVAAISYVACGGTDDTSTFGDGGKDAVTASDAISGNLAPPPDAGPDAPADAGDASSDADTDANVKGDGSIVINDGGLVKDANKGD